MHNVVVVSMNKESAGVVATRIANMMSINYINADMILAENLIRTVDYPLSIADDLMRSMENRIQQMLAETTDCIISMSDDLFLSNKLHENLQKSLKILVKVDKTEEVDIEIQKLLEKYCDVIINEKDIDFDKLVKLMK